MHGYDFSRYDRFSQGSSRAAFFANVSRNSTKSSAMAMIFLNLIASRKDPLELLFLRMYREIRPNPEPWLWFFSVGSLLARILSELHFLRMYREIRLWLWFCSVGSHSCSFLSCFRWWLWFFSIGSLSWESVFFNPYPYTLLFIGYPLPIHVGLSRRNDFFCQILTQFC